MLDNYQKKKNTKKPQKQYMQIFTYVLSVTKKKKNTKKPQKQYMQIFTYVLSVTKKKKIKN